MIHYRAVAGIFSCRAEGNFVPKGRNLRSAGPTAASPLLPAKGSVRSPSEVWGGAPAAKRFSRVSHIQSCLSRQSNVVHFVPCKGRILLMLIILGVYWYNFQNVSLKQLATTRAMKNNPGGCLGCLNGRYSTALNEPAV